MGFAYKLKENVTESLYVLAPALLTQIRALNYRRKRCEEELDLLPLLCSRDKRSVDVGANLGLYAYFIAKVSQDVLMVEPNKVLSRRLARVFGEKKVKRLAVSDTDGTAELRIPIRSSFDGRGIASLADHLSTDSAVRIERVVTARLDSLGLANIGFIKIDVEGHELAALRGATALLAKEHPNLIIEIEERHCPGSLQAVTNLLSTLGYHGFHYSDARLRPINVAHVKQQQEQFLRDEFARGGPRIRYLNNFVFTAHLAHVAHLL